MIARAEWANGWGGLQAQMLHIAQGNALGGAYALIKVSRPLRATCFMRGNAPWHCVCVCYALGARGIISVKYSNSYSAVAYYFRKILAQSK